jgi:hypothetical protein
VVSNERQRYLLDLAEQVARGQRRPEDICEEEQFTDEEYDLVLRFTAAMVEYLQHRRRQGNRRALRLLRSLLDPEQRACLRRNRHFYVTAASGKTYRLIPGTGGAQEVERHGRYWYVRDLFCLHPPRDEHPEIPNADTTIAHLLMLRYDERAFVREANRTQTWPVREWGTVNAGWASAWRRRLNERRRLDAVAEMNRIAEAELRAEGVDPEAFLAELEGRLPGAAVA